MSRPKLDVPVPALALRRAEAAAALGVSLETFDAHVRPHLPVARVGGVSVYPVAALAAWLTSQATAPVEDNLRRVA